MQEEYRGYTINIEQDEVAESPREWSNLSKMYYRHRDYILGDESIPDHFYDDKGSYIEIDDLDTFKEWRKAQGDQIVICLPLEIYDHSGVSMWVGNNPDHVDYRWDCSQVGWIVVTKQDIRDNWSVKNVTRKLIVEAESIAKSEVEIFNQYLTGDVWGYTIEGKDGVTDDSCWGFYGVEDCLEEAKSMVDWYIEDEQKKHLAKTKQYIKSGVELQYRFV